MVVLPPAVAPELQPTPTSIPAATMEQGLACGASPEGAYDLTQDPPSLPGKVSPEPARDELTGELAQETFSRSVLEPLLESVLPLECSLPSLFDIANILSFGVMSEFL